MTPRQGPRRGSALVSAVGLIAVAGALAGTLATLAREALRMTHLRRTTTAALATADGCLARAVARLDPGWDFEPALAGPDALAGTPDDGVIPVPGGCDVTAQRASPARIVLEATAVTTEGNRRVAAVAGRSPAPGTGALVWLGALDEPGEITGALELVGADAPTPTAVLAGPGDPTVLDAWLAGQRGVLSGTRVESPVRLGALPLDVLVERARSAEPLHADALAAGPGPPAVYLASGEFAPPGALRGAGLLVVEGTLDIRGAFEFKGVVVVLGGVRVEAGASLDVAGELWIGGRPGLVVRGVAAVRADPPAVAAADALLALPRRAMRLGWRDRS